MAVQTQQPINDLLLEIAHCPNVRQCLTTRDPGHPCAEIVLSQGSQRLEDHQVPEPWNGDLANAPILFLASNPSIGADEAYPLGSWPDDLAADYFTHRFGGGRKVWTKDLHVLQVDGTYSKDWVRFWAAVRSRAAELIGKDKNTVRLGVDCMLAEVVHCKSKGEIGVAGAVEECANRYLGRILALTRARVIVCLGTFAGQIVRQRFGIPEKTNVYGPIQIGEQARYFTFLPHPNHRGVRTFEGCISAEELKILRSFLAKRKPQKDTYS